MRATSGGSIATRADASHQLGDFRLIVEGINRTLDTLLEPVEESCRVVTRIAGGDLTARVVGEYLGDQAQIKNDINSMAASIQGNLGNVAKSAKTLESASEELRIASQRMAANANKTADQASAVSTASEQISRNVMSVATSGDQMHASIARSRKIRVRPPELLEVRSLPRVQRTKPSRNWAHRASRSETWSR